MQIVFYQDPGPIGSHLIAFDGPVLAIAATALLVESVKLFSILVTPFILFALIIHWLEYLTQHRMAERFGWKSVMWTGWLGTPIHELSHAFMCRIFHHRIDEIALFEPDPESGRLGFVRHSFKPGNWYQELGNFFIGVAPLLGGSIVLTAILWLFFPDAVSSALDVARNQDNDSGAWVRMGGIVAAVANQIVAERQWLTGRFWLFVYFVLCVGSHMAPSPSDYRGASRGVYLVGGGLLLFTFVLAAAGTDAESLVDGMIGLLGPLFAVFGLTIVLVGLTALLVQIATSFFPQRYRVG